MLAVACKTETLEHRVGGHRASLEEERTVHLRNTNVADRRRPLADMETSRAGDVDDALGLRPLLPLCKPFCVMGRTPVVAVAKCHWQMFSNISVVVEVYPSHIPGAYSIVSMVQVRA